MTGSTPSTNVWHLVRWGLAPANLPSVRAARRALGRQMRRGERSAGVRGG